METGVGTFLITMNDVFLISETMSIGFLIDDVMAGSDIQPVPTKWHEPAETAVAVKMAGDAAIMSDTECPGCEYRLHDLQMLQFPLTSYELMICKDNC